MRSRVAVLALIGLAAVAAIGWILSGSSQPGPARLGTRNVPPEASSLESGQVEPGGHEAMEPRTVVAPQTESRAATIPAQAAPAPVFSVYDEGASRLPAAALIALILEEGKVIRTAEGKRSPALSRENMILSAEAELKRLMADPKWNPSGQPLSDDELAFASSALADHDEFEATLKTQLLGEQDRAWEASVTLGLFAEREPPPREPPPTVRESARLSDAELLALNAARRDRGFARTREMGAQLGQLGKDWTYVSLGAAGRDFDVYCTPATAPEVFSTSARIGTLRGQRRQWTRTYFLGRRPVRPDYLPPR